MLFLASLLGLMLAAVALTSLAGRIKVPAPTLLAVGGAALALLPHPPPIRLEPELALALFVAPVLLDAAYDTSLRDLRDDWVGVTGLVVAAVGLTTAAVALIVHRLVPDLPWGAAIALGAIVAPPDAVAAIAVLRAVRPPHRLVVVLQGESLLNDATALLVYRLAVAATVSGGFAPARALPMFLVASVGSVAFGMAWAWINIRLMPRLTSPRSTVVQFAQTIGLWLLADLLRLSPVLTLVAFAMTVARRAPASTPARERVANYAVWDFATFVLQVLAFVLIGLQLRPILERLNRPQRDVGLVVAGAVLLTVILVRIFWVMSFNAVLRWTNRRFGFHPPRPMMRATVQSGLVVSWCGMRGIVTLAAAYALPAKFPGRDLILLCAFTVVVGTLVIQGLTLGPLLRWFNLDNDHPVEREVAEGRTQAIRAALDALDGEASPAAEAVRREYSHALEMQDKGKADTKHNMLRRKAIAAARKKALELRHSDVLGDDAFHVLEEELDRLDLGAEPMTQP